jgi:NAD(P)-dependent dehydrogenase (short-subunit alcohol dehydrogenase family)|tara:strand:- start:1040 stop:1900 length:861 start_codon:yes stop_codon:yes gene_type:complete
MHALRDKTAVVTGAGRGLGRAMAKGLKNAGLNVVLVELDPEVLNDAVTDIGEGCIGIAADVSKADDAQRILDETLLKFGDLHILINNAGLGPQRFRDTDRTNAKMIWEIDLEDWNLYLDVNTTAHFVMVKVIVPHLLKSGWGRVINVTTSLETMINHTNGAYGPSKAGAEALATMIAGGLEGTGVTCNVLIPGGPADTRMISPTGIYEDRSKLIQPDVMLPPLLALLSETNDQTNNQRVRAALWDQDADMDTNMRKASAPIAWPQLGGQAIHPEGDPRGNPDARNV